MSRTNENINECTEKDDPICIFNPFSTAIYTNVIRTFPTLAQRLTNVVFTRWEWFQQNLLPALNVYITASKKRRKRNSGGSSVSQNKL